MSFKIKSKFTIALIAVILVACVASGVATAGFLNNKKQEQAKKIFVNSADDIKLLSKSFDSIAIGDSGSESSHKLSKSGTIAAEKVTAEIGLVKNEFTTLAFNKKADSMTFYMDISTLGVTNAENPVVLEIEEVHTGNFLAFGYTVSIDDKPVYFRNYEQLITGSENIYIQIGRKDIKDTKNIKVTISSEGNSKFNISKVMMYSDFYGLADSQGLYTKMGVNVFVGSNEINNLNAIMKQYKREYQTFQIGIQTDYPFIQTGTADMKLKMETLINMGRTNNMPVLIMPARWWGTTPYTVDGKGGYFSDLKYNEVVYNPVTKKYQMTTPNIWANTPWPSMNEPQANAVGAEKIKEFSSYFSNRYALMQAKYPEATNPYYFVMEWGSGYWTVFDVIGAGGDFSDYVVSDAAKDGVILNPEDGLSDGEKEWMFKNVARYNDIEAKAYKEGITTNSIIVNKGKIQYPQYQVLNNLYSHSTQGTIYPSLNDRIPAWKSAVTTNNWPSMEMLTFADQRHYDYSMALGKITCVNLEMTIVTKLFFQEYLRKSYANGMEFVTMFNPKKNEEGMYIKQVDKLEDKPFTKKITYNQNIIDLNFLRDNNKNYQTAGIPNAVKVTNLAISQDGNLGLSDTTKPGEIIFKATNADGFKNGLNLDVEAFTQMNGKLSFFAGTDIAKLTPLREFKMGQKIDFFNAKTLYKQDLGKETPGKDIYIKIVFDSKNFLEGARVGAIRVSVPWGFKTGQLNSENLTYKQKRLQSLNTQYRVVAQRLLSQYMEKNKTEDDVYKKAKALYENAQYMDVFKFLSMSVSEAIPASFSINSYGRLGKYPIDIKLESDDNTAVVKLLKASNDGYEMSFVADKIQDVTVTVDKLTPGQKYSVNRIGENTIEIKADPKGESLKSGVLEFVTKIRPPLTNKITGHIEGVATEVGANSVKLEIQDPKIGNYSYGSSFIFTASCTFKRFQEGSNVSTSEKPQRLDYVVAKLNENGSIVSVEAKYGTITGSVKTYYQPELKGANQTNGVIELTNGMKFELSYNNNMTNFNMVSLSGRAKDFSYDVLRDAIKPGMILSIDYIPGTYNNTNRRIININQSVITLLKEDYEGIWATKAWSTKNIKAVGLDTNLTFKVLQPDNNTIPGEVVYKFATTRPIDNASLTYSGRAIMNEGNGVRLYVSLDEKKWTLIEDLNTKTFESNAATKERNVNFSNYVKDRTFFYLKAQITTTIETWGSLNDLTVKAVTK